MASQETILEPISDLSAHVQEKITRRLLGRPPIRLFNGEPSAELCLRPYFSYYAEQCNQAFHDGRMTASIKTHQDVIRIIELLMTTMARDEVREMVPCHYGAQEDIDAQDASINLAARLLLMMNIGDFRNTIAGRRGLQWEQSCLSVYIKDHFCAPARLSDERVKLDKTFTALSLNRIAGIEIILTNNLADHLRLSKDGTTLEIFHHASFLEYQREGSIFPNGLATETLRTLALLFPQSDKPTQKWFEKFRLSQNVVVDERLLTCGRIHLDDRQIEDFHFWHDRLVMLKQVYDEARPSTVAQWWNDRRNGVQWYTFWVAVLVLVLTVFFGLVQSVEGALQVYKAYRPSSKL